MHFGAEVVFQRTDCLHLFQHLILLASISIHECAMGMPTIRRVADESENEFSFVNFAADLDNQLAKVCIIGSDVWKSTACLRPRKLPVNCSPAVGVVQARVSKSVAKMRWQTEAKCEHIGFQSQVLQVTKFGQNLFALNLIFPT